MDPNACLDRAAQAIDDGDIDEAEAALDNYRSWRRRGGFEAMAGDERERELRRRLLAAKMKKEN